MLVITFKRGTRTFSEQKIQELAFLEGFFSPFRSMVGGYLKDGEGKGGRQWLCASSTKVEIYCTVKLHDHSLLLSQLIKYDEKENTSPLRTSSYFLSCKHCSENC